MSAVKFFEWPITRSIRAIAFSCSFLCAWLALGAAELSAQTFSEVAGAAGVDESGEGRGAAWGDFDSDGNLDIFLTRNGVDRLYQNNGNGTFTNAEVSAGVNNSGQGQAIALGDYNGDGYLDIYVSRAIGGNLLYRNSGGLPLSFIQEATQVGITTGGGGRGAAWFDYDGDGDLDLFLAVSVGTPNRLYRNDGGTFIDIAAAEGLADTGNSGSATLGDYDNDGDLDIYLILDGGNKLYRNNGVGVSPQFTDVGAAAGVNINEGSGAQWGDYDNDGDLDLYVAHSALDDVLYQNDGASPLPQFTDVGLAVGITTSIDTGAPSWVDYDNDGDLDLHVTRPGDNLLYQNNGSGSFVDVAAAEGVNDGGNGRSNAWGDYDNDGDLDLYVTNHISGFTRLFQNGGNSNRWLQLELVGTASNGEGVGATLTATTGATNQRRDLHPGQGYFGQSSRMVEFGFGGTVTVDQVRVEWPSGTVQLLNNVATNQKLTVVEAATMQVSVPAITATYNESIAIPVQLTSTFGLGIVSAEIFLCFDSDLLTAPSADLTGTLAATGWSIETNVVQGNGTNIDTVKMAMATDDDVLAGAGTLVNINFSVADLRVPAFSELSLEHVLFNDGTPANVTTNGSVTLTGIDGTISSLPTTIIPRETITITVVDADADLDGTPGNDQISVTVENTSNGDTVNLTLDEDAVTAGTFSGTVDTEFGLVAVVDALIQAQAGDVIVSTYSDALDAAGSGPANRTAQTDVIGGVDGSVAITLVSQPGDPLYIQVIDADLNTSFSSAETASVTVENSRTLESFTVVLTEVDLDDDVFFGQLPTISGASTSTDMNTQEEDIVTATYDDVVTAVGDQQDRTATDEVINPWGDADDNEQLQAFDAAQVLIDVLSGGTYLSGVGELAANVDIDPVGTGINPFDASLILQKRVGLISIFPVQLAASSNHPQPTPASPKPVVVNRWLTLSYEDGYVSLRADERAGMVSGDLLIEGVDGTVAMAEELSAFLSASRKTDDGLRIVFAGAAPVSGPGELLRIYPGVGPDKVRLIRAQFNGGRIEAQVDGILSISAMPSAFVLYANMPNPFNPETTIRFELPQESAVKLEVFDVLGQKVRTLVAQELPAGAHSIVWDGRNERGGQVGNGLYLYRLEAGDFSQMRRMLLLK